ncbi:MAG: 50S ribosomal protein L10 [Phycisphaerae bacterium]|nr:50S ribosomal protein L10 [Phycisphaerae bacterium]
MSYFVKGLVQSEYAKKFEGMTEFVVISTMGVSGVNNNVMRGELKQKGLRAVVVRNNLMRRALQEMELKGADDLFDSGQCTVVFGGEGAGIAAKEVVAWAKKLKTIELKGGYIDGTVVKGDAGVKTLATMPTRAELQGQIVQIALTPGSKVAGAILGAGGAIAGCIKSVIEKREKEAA